MEFEYKQTGRLVTVIGVILIMMAFAIGYMGKVIDFKTITAPFESAFGGSSSSDSAEEAEDSEEDRASEAENAGEESEDGSQEEDNSDSAAPNINAIIEQTPGLSKAQKLYLKYQGIMESFERSLSEIPNRFAIVICLWLLFALKSIIPIVPATFTCLVTALIFPFPLAVFINLCGYAIMFLAKYYWGKYVGEGAISKFVKKSKVLWKYIQDEETGKGNGNPIVLFILRLVPTIPLNPISAMYGNMGYDLWKFMLLSMLGISLRVISVTSIGSNVGDPFSKAFALPLFLILFISGASMLIFSSVLRKREKKEMKAKMKAAADTAINEVAEEQPKETAVESMSDQNETEDVSEQIEQVKEKSKH